MRKLLLASAAIFGLSAPAMATPPTTWHLVLTTIWSGNGISTVSVGPFFDKDSCEAAFTGYTTGASTNLKPYMAQYFYTIHTCAVNSTPAP